MANEPIRSGRANEPHSERGAPASVSSSPAVQQTSPQRTTPQRTTGTTGGGAPMGELLIREGARSRTGPGQQPDERGGSGRIRRVRGSWPAAFRAGRKPVPPGVRPHLPINFPCPFFPLRLNPYTVGRHLIPTPFPVHPPRAPRSDSNTEPFRSIPSERHP